MHKFFWFLGQFGTLFYIFNLRISRKILEKTVQFSKVFSSHLEKLTDFYIFFGFRRKQHRLEPVLSMTNDKVFPVTGLPRLPACHPWNQWHFSGIQYSFPGPYYKYIQTIHPSYTAWKYKKKTVKFCLSDFLCRWYTAHG